MAKQSRAQKDTVKRVMHEFKEGDLRIRGNGPKVRNPKQAVAIALHEAGASNQESPRRNRENLQKTKSKGRKGAAKPGRAGAAATSSGKSLAQSPRERLGRSFGTGRGGATERNRADLYAEAKRRNLPGRSRMSKAELERALR
jgi:Family of unknown function (DUF6496)